MDLTSKKNIKNLLKKHGLRPTKRLGQNFLIDKSVLKKIILTSELNSFDEVLEIGPGIGTLTQELAKKVKKVMAVEKDQKMVGILKETLKDFENIDIILGDIRKIEDYKVKIKNYKVVGNLPFYLTAPIIRKFLEMKEAKPQSIVLVVQKEVGQRICAKPSKMNLLAISVQFYAEPQIISYISKKSFWPQPKVDAVIVKITPRPSLIGDSKLFFKVVKAGFSQPRKQLINNLSKGLKMPREKVKTWLLENNILPIQRAETLTVENWLKLVKTLKVDN